MRAVFSLGACATVVGAGLLATAAPAAACPNGTVPSHFDGVCISGAAGGQAGGQAVVPTAPSGTGAVMEGGVNQLPRVNGIPCTPEHLGTCIGMMESQG